MNNNNIHGFFFLYQVEEKLYTVFFTKEHTRSGGVCDNWHQTFVFEFIHCIFQFQSHSENPKVLAKSNHTLLRTKFKSPINFREPSHTAFNSS